MTEMVTHTCSQHPSPFDCADHLIYYISQFDEYGLLIHDGGAAYLAIVFCPWCGRRLPESKRDLWFDELAAMGFDDPVEQEIPEAYKSDEWYAKRSSGS